MQYSTVDDKHGLLQVGQMAVTPPMGYGDLTSRYVSPNESALSVRTRREISVRTSRGKVNTVSQKKRVKTETIWSRRVKAAVDLESSERLHTVDISAPSINRERIQ